jgi:hypothetical protein
MVVDQQELMPSCESHAAGTNPGEEAESTARSEEQNPGHRGSEQRKLYREAQRVVVWILSGEMQRNEMLLPVEDSETRELAVDDRTSGAD